MVFSQDFNFRTTFNCIKMKKDFFIIWLYIAALAAVYYFFKQTTQRKKYYEYVNGLGFGSYWLDQMTNQELKDFYTYIHDYTQKGIQVKIGSPLDLRLVEIGKKFPAILNYK